MKLYLVHFDVHVTPYGQEVPPNPRSFHRIGVPVEAESEVDAVKRFGVWLKDAMAWLKPAPEQGGAGDG